MEMRFRCTTPSPCVWSLRGIRLALKKARTIANRRVGLLTNTTGISTSCDVACQEFPIRTNMVVAARLCFGAAVECCFLGRFRYQIIEYLGSAAFSRAVQCLDLDTNKMVCMKIIKNDKARRPLQPTHLRACTLLMSEDFFDQSLDEIKLLKYINVNGDVDYNNVLRTAAQMGRWLPERH